MARQIARDTKHGGQPPTVAVVLRTLLRVLTVLVATELSGAVHVGLDLAAEYGLAERAADDCETDGHECPPGCPGCHCPHGAVAWHAPAFDGFAEMPLPQVEANFCANRTLPPREADLAGLYRPPKVNALI